MLLLPFLTTGIALAVEAPGVASPAKSKSILYPSERIEKALAAGASDPWVIETKNALIDKAAPWVKMSDDELWDLIFGPNINRSWMVWSDGFCPACKHDVKMYNWVMDVWAHPWKVKCPHCNELFPKNDFHAYHKSGLDEHGIFQPAKADRSLLFNTEHPDPGDPMRLFGVDDGEGYVDAEGRRWRFIGAYLIYGQWKKWIHAGITNLSNAWLVTKDPVYARKAAILLDRVADVYPAFDFGKQGWVYETQEATRGQISTWHDAAREDYELIRAYDRIFEGARASEKVLVEYLSRKAKEHQLNNPKTSWADIQRNIEEGLFRDTLNHREKIESNYPSTDQTMLFIKVVLDWPNNKEDVFTHLDEVIKRATAVDGLSGEKGLAGYSRIAPQMLAEILSQFSRIEPGFLKTIFERHPVLHQTWRFHIDTHCLDNYYPQTGDSGNFAQRVPAYVGLALGKDHGVEPSMYTHLWELYNLTGDAAFAQVMFRENANTAEGLPYDLFCEDPAALQGGLKAVIDKAGTDIQLGSINKKDWRLAILRSGKGGDRRALWIDYDSTGPHSHADGMNIGLFAKGLDLLPDFGYPPVGYGGWGAPKAVWYKRTAAHATVVIDGQEQRRVNSGATTLWADGERFRAIRVSDPAMYNCKRYERTVALVDVDDRDSYVLDYFLVEGGTDHAKFMHSAFGTIDAQGINQQPAPDYGHNTEMQAFRTDPAPIREWSVDWKIEDRYKYLPEGSDIHFRLTDLTNGASASTVEAWIDASVYGTQGTAEYVPCVMTRRIADASPLLSAFVAVLEPYEAESNLEKITRLPLPEPSVGIEILRKDGKRDVCVITAPEQNSEALSREIPVQVKGAMAFVSFKGKSPERVVLCQGTELKAGGLEVTMKEKAEFVEMVLEKGKARVVAGEGAKIESVKDKGRVLELIR